MKKIIIFISTLALACLLTANVYSELRGDLNGDGVVDGDDLSIFAEDYGKSETDCVDNDDCPRGYYCKKAVGDCEGKGICSARPDVCPLIWDPVCGCDGETYANLCLAAAAGVNVMHKGECPMSGQFRLGEIFSLNYQEKKHNADENIGIKFESVLSDSRCPIDVNCVWEGNAEVEFIFSKNNVLRSIVLNTGIEPTKVSLFGYEIKLVRLEPPVLSNNPPEQEDYMAYLVIIRSPASCFDNTECSNDSYCAKEPGDCDGSGKCTRKPEACIQIFDPVCGCDGNTYSNECSAAMAGVNVAFEGECRDTSCDDGSTVICLMIPPICTEHEILAIQNNCWVCVNPATCRPWGEPGCEIESEGSNGCPEGFYCDPCGTSSCPLCDDCVPACVSE